MMNIFLFCFFKYLLYIFQENSFTITCFVHCTCLDQLSNSKKPINTLITIKIYTPPELINQKYFNTNFSPFFFQLKISTFNNTKNASMNGRRGKKQENSLPRQESVHKKILILESESGQEFYRIFFPQNWFCSS